MKHDEYQLDDRKKEDILKQIQKLAKSYTPEWEFDMKKPDVGSVLALLFANQLSDNIKRFNQGLDRCHADFINLLDISLHPAHPARAIVLMDMLDNTVPGSYVPKGTRFYAEKEDERVIFESKYPVYLSPARLAASFATFADEGKILPVYGSFEYKDYLGETEVHMPKEWDEEESYKFCPFNFYDSRGEGMEKHAMVFYHSSIFDVENEPINCLAEGNDHFLTDVETGRIQLLYYTEDGIRPVEHVKIVGDKVVFVKEQPNKKVSIDGNLYSVLIFEYKEMPDDSEQYDSIRFSSDGGVRPPEYVGNGSSDYEIDSFDMFGSTLSAYSECYIGMNSYFSKEKSKITIQFNARYGENFIGYRQEEDDGGLKIIKRRRRGYREQAITYCMVNEITIEYFNGHGWKRLECDQSYRTMFENAQPGFITLSFTCPEDWQDTQTGSYMGKALRIQVVRADNSYLQPGIHRYPIIQNMRISYSYEDAYEKPILGEVFYGTKRVDITDALQAEQPFVGYEKSNYIDSALYLGFDQVFEKGPVSLWWKLSEVNHDVDRKFHFYYSTSSGFKELKMVDYTDGLSRTGVMMFLPPFDMALRKIEGKNLCWLKITQDAPKSKRDSLRIDQISLNGVVVDNIDTREVEDFYLETAKSNMSFQLHADNILDAEVWVNEKNELTDAAMKKMLTENPDQCRATYNYLGNIEQFFVLWEEKDNFNYSTAKDRHYVLDRLERRVIFGDGVHVSIPRNLSDIAFTVRVRCCNGALGNVGPGEITVSDSNIMYVREMYNPDAAYGGSNMESVAKTLERGTNMLSSGGRFVTERDYLNEILNYSENIDKAAIVLGEDRNRRKNDEQVFIPILMKDYKNGSSAFYRIQRELKSHLKEHCELLLGEDDIQIVEPVFVELSVDVWIEILRMEDSFEVQTEAIEMIQDFLDPVTRQNHKGWRIGEVPKKKQIQMCLNSIKRRMMVRRILITARYESENGYVEVDLEQLKISPYMVVVNGKHHVYTMQSDQEA